MSRSRSKHPDPWREPEHNSFQTVARHRAANRRQSALPKSTSMQLVRCCACLCNVPALCTLLPSCMPGVGCARLLPQAS